MVAFTEVRAVSVTEPKKNIQRKAMNTWRGMTTRKFIVQTMRVVKIFSRGRTQRGKISFCQLETRGTFFEQNLPNLAEFA